MNVFQRLRRDAKKIPWGATFNVLVEGLASHTEGAGEIFAELREWGSHLSRNAVLKWTPMLVTRTRCESPDVSTGKPRKCEGTAPFRCDICNRACCLAHARVDYMGDAICEVCIGQAKARKRAEDKAKEKPDLVAAAFKTLGLDAESTFEEVKKRYKELVLKHNADRPQTDKKRARNTERLKEVNGAFVTLRDHFEKKKAEAA